jgi:NAD(P)H-dependent FMN reductase
MKFPRSVLSALPSVVEDNGFVEVPETRYAWNGNVALAYQVVGDVTDAPEAVARIRSTVRDADAILFSTPEYNSSIPGAR